MAYYDDIPGKKKRKHDADDAWEDEAPRARRFGPDDGGRREQRPRGRSDYRDGRAEYASNRDSRAPRRDDREDRPSYRDSEYRPAPNGKNRAPRRDDRDDRPSYRDSEYRPASNGKNRAPRRDDRDDRPSYRDSDYRPAPNGKNRAPRRDDRDDRPSYRDSEYRPASNGKNRAPRRDDRDDRPSYRDSEYRPAPTGKNRPPRREEDDRAASYRDSEYRPASVREEPPVYENLIVGRNPIREALKSGRDLEKLLVQKGELSGSAREIVEMAKAARVPVQEVDKARLDEITRHHQGMLAFASAYQYSTVEAMLAEAEEKGEAPFLILLDGVTDPHNLGAIIRSAECAGAHGVIVPERRSVGLTPAAVKASAGAVEHVKVARVTNLNRTIEMLQKRGVWLYAVTMEGQDYEQTDFSGGVALVIGGEGEGISRMTLEHCDARVSLPLRGKIDSLNASVAAGIMMYRVLSCRRS